MDIFTTEFILGHLNYWLFIILMMTGLYIVIGKGNLVKKIVGLNIFQTSVFMFYISMGKVEMISARRKCRTYPHRISMEL